MPWKGRTIVLGLFGVALAMAIGGWWFRYNASRRAAAFWGAEGARLLAGDAAVELLVLGEGEAGGAGQTVAGRPVRDKFDLTEKRGLIHLRYALTQDANFSWDQAKRVPAGDGPAWRYALEFAQGEARLVAAFTADFAQLGKPTHDGALVDVLPCPRLAPAIDRYLREVGAPIDKAEEPASR